MSRKKHHPANDIDAVLSGTDTIPTDVPPDYRCGFVGFIGRPNAGKSTLLNRLVGEKIAAVSDKPQTTRTRIQGILTRPDGQIVFVDTPGIHKPGYKLNKRMMQAVLDTVATVDLLILLRDASVPTGNGDRFVLDLVKEAKRPTFLVLNKIDKIAEKSRLLPLLDFYKSEYDFVEYLPISGLKADNTKALLDRIVTHLPQSPPLFPEDALTDQTDRTLVAELVREQLLRNLSAELPFATAVVTEQWQEQPNGVLKLACVIYVERESQRPIVIGRGGERLKKIASSARFGIEKMLDRHVFLELFVKVQSHWRNDERMLDLMGIERVETGKAEEDQTIEADTEIEPDALLDAESDVPIDAESDALIDAESTDEEAES